LKEAFSTLDSQHLASIVRKHFQIELRPLCAPLQSRACPSRCPSRSLGSPLFGP